MSDASEGGPAAADVVIWPVQDHEVDVYRLVRGTTVIGEFTGRSIGSRVFSEAVKHSGPGRAVWLKDELSVRRLNEPERTD
jgi:hypothetical protein